MTDLSLVTVDPESKEMFRLVDKPLYGPEYCCVTLRPDDPEGFVDTCNELQYAGPRIYVSVGGIRRLAKFINHQDPEAKALREEVEQLEARVFELEDELTEMDKNFQAVDRLQRVGYRSQKKPGRKPKPRVDEQEAA